MKLSTFRLRTLSGANVVGLLIGMSLFSMFFFISLYLQRVLGLGALEAGLAYLPLSFVIIIAAGIASQLVTKIGFKPTLIMGSLLTAPGLLWFTQISVDGSFTADVLGPSLLAAAGLGVLVRPGDDRSGDRHPCGSGRTGLRTHQHLSADRWRARGGDPRLHRDIRLRRHPADGAPGPLTAR